MKRRIFYAVPKEQTRQIITDNNLSSIADVYSLLKDSFKDILSTTVGTNETSKFWLGMLNDMKNRNVQDVLFFCVGGLAGFKEAIAAVFPDAQLYSRGQVW